MLKEHTIEDPIMHIPVLTHDEVQTKVNIIIASEVTENYDSFDEFFRDNFEYINFKKKFLGGWVGWNYKKTHPDIFNLYVKNILRMCFIDLKARET